MKKILIIAAAAAALAGCQTRITAEKHPEQMLPIYGYAPTGSVVYIKGYLPASGGWYATARSPLWADEAMKGLNISVATNGTVALSLDDYSRDLSTNAVATTTIIMDGAVKLAEKVAAAIVSSGASPVADGIQSLVSKYIAAGGKVDNATITCKDGSCSITDGNTTCTDDSCCVK